MKPVRRTVIEWVGDEEKEYDKLREEARRENISIQILLKSKVND